MKQAFLAVVLLIALSSSVHPQDSDPVITLEDSLLCRHKDVDKNSCITPPTQIYSPKPKYPEAERQAHREGGVKLKLVIRPDGVPSDVTVSQTLMPDFDSAAIDAVKQWRFSPAMKGGKAIPVQIAIEVNFSLHR